MTWAAIAAMSWARAKARKCCRRWGCDILHRRPVEGPGLQVETHRQSRVRPSWEVDDAPHVLLPSHTERPRVPHIHAGGGGSGVTVNGDEDEASCLRTDAEQGPRGGPRSSPVQEGASRAPLINPLFAITSILPRASRREVGSAARSDCPSDLSCRAARLVHVSAFVSWRSRGHRVHAAERRAVASAV